ncbi:MAG: amino-acid N-acetyltransferase [Cycloclasticus sp. symbiont of Poecilosclerida sp. M]|nr:MAG: amino-acid N-acetyltransferase [Cycloclasticus sp. symbiont of Poecilosclerida sp. M]
MLRDAKSIIEIFGGIKPLAKAIGKNPATIYRWTYPKDKGGTGGLIPSHALNKILLAAKDKGLNIGHLQDNLSIQTDKQSHSKPQQFVSWFRSTAPYIQTHRGKTFVISFNGEAVDDIRFLEMVQDFALLSSLGIRLILVHGIRSQLEQRLKASQKESLVFNHLRVTTKSTLKLVEESVGAVRSKIEAQFSSTLTNSTLSDAYIQIASGNWITAKPLGIINGVNYQFTGEVRRVNSESINAKLNTGDIVLVSPIGYSPSGDTFNLRCEEVATAIAVSLRADKLILLTERAELLTEKNKLITQLTTQEAVEHLAALEQKTAPVNPLDDTLLHLREAVFASQQGVKRVHLIDRRINGGIQLELFTRHGAGTLISSRPFEEVRAAIASDVPGILKLIKPLIEKGLLTERSADDVERDIEKFHIIEQDGLITTCAALYQYPDSAMAELACVAVHPDYRTGERGEHLLTMLQQTALDLHLNQLFVLTTQSSHWFLERGFTTGSLSDLPAEKLKNYNHSRRSSVMIKRLG